MRASHDMVSQDSGIICIASHSKDICLLYDLWRWNQYRNGEKRNHQHH